MGKAIRWRNLRDSMSVQCEINEGEIFEIDADKLPKFLHEHLEPIVKGYKDFNIVIEYLCDGFYDPGRTEGDPEFCYPPADDDERFVDKVYLETDNGKNHIPIDQDMAEKIFEHYEKRIMSRDLPESYDYFDDECEHQS